MCRGGHNSTLNTPPKMEQNLVRTKYDASLIAHYIVCMCVCVCVSSDKRGREGEEK